MIRFRFPIPAVLVRAFFLAHLAALSPVLAGGGLATEPPRFATSEVAVVSEKGRFLFTVEMAVNQKQRAQGFQNRRSLAPSAGMLFDFGRPQPVAMWMKNTYVSLDMLFIDNDGRIINIGHRTEPLSLRAIQSRAPARAVLEVTAGTAARLGLIPGDRVIHGIFGDGG
jgi:hypothetical protein